MPLVFDSPLSRFFTSSHADTSMDKDLRFLARCENSELRKLCDILTHDKDGHLRFAEQLTTTDVYLEHYPERMQDLAPAIADELLRFGSNRLATSLRHFTPDSYEVVVRKVCRQMKVEVGKYDGVSAMERALLENLCESSIKSMSLNELRNLADEAGISSKGLRKQALVAAILVAMRVSPMSFRRIVVSTSYRILSIMVGRRLALVGVRAAQGMVGALSGPLGCVLLSIWTAWDIASPSYRVCIPAVIQVALMRLSSKSELKEGRKA